MQKISCAGCLGLSPAIPAQFTLKMCVAAHNRKKFTTNLYFEGSRSFKVIDVETPRSSSLQHVMCLSATVFTLDEPITAK